MTGAAVAGVLVVDKPSGMTSHDVVQRARRIVGERRIGHGGTLDPLATGVLPLLVGRATRLLRYMTSDPKVYQTVAKLGYETTTADVDGEALAAAVPVDVSERVIALALDDFRGDIEQIPPMYSAKKVDGTRLHRIARTGAEVERQPIQVRIGRLELVALAGDELALEVECSPGTYIRSLVVDLGRRLGCGATVQQLRRTRSGQFWIADAVPLDSLTAEVAAARTLPIDRLPLALDDLVLDESQATGFCAGRRLPLTDLGASTDGAVAARTADGRLLGVGELEGALLRPRVVLSAQGLDSA